MIQFWLFNDVDPTPLFFFTPAKDVWHILKLAVKKERRQNKVEKGVMYAKGFCVRDVSGMQVSGITEKDVHLIMHVVQ